MLVFRANDVAEHSYIRTVVICSPNTFILSNTMHSFDSMLFIRPLPLIIQETASRAQQLIYKSITVKSNLDCYPLYSLM